MKNLLFHESSAVRRNSLVLFAMPGILVLSLLISCKESDNGGNPGPVFGTENVGSGYDVFDNYAEVSKVKAAILDINKLNAAGLIEQKTVENGIFTTTSGTTIDEYSSSLGISASLQGSYMYFSGAIKTNFHEDRYLYEEYSFATVKSLVQKTQLRIPSDVSVEDLKPYLKETARSKINDPDVSPEVVFNTYGTHCLRGVILGGRLDYSVSAKTTDLMNGKSIGVYAEASFSKGGVSIGGSGELVTDEEYSTFMNSCKKILHVYGGQAEFGQDIINTDDYTAWTRSISDHPVFCNFTQNGLIPVWEFCDTQSRRDELAAYFDTWAEARKIVVNPPEPRLCILDVMVIFGSNPSELYLAPNGRTYHLLHGDLNVGCGSSSAYIWIYYLLDKENDQTFAPIAEIRTLDETDGEYLSNLPGTGWVRLPENLNKGAGGDNIFIAYRRVANETESPLTGLSTELIDSPTHNDYYSLYTDGSTSWFPVVKLYAPTIKQDLNESATGSWFVYLYFTYDPLTPKQKSRAVTGLP